jgi:hypothetical protein
MLDGILWLKRKINPRCLSLEATAALSKLPNGQCGLWNPLGHSFVGVLVVPVIQEGGSVPRILFHDPAVITGRYSIFIMEQSVENLSKGCS